MADFCINPTGTARLLFVLDQDVLMQDLRAGFFKFLVGSYWQIEYTPSGLPANPCRAQIMRDP